MFGQMNNKDNQAQYSQDVENGHYVPNAEGTQGVQGGNGNMAYSAPMYARSKNIKKVVIISIALAAAVGFMGGMMIGAGKAPSEASIRKQIEQDLAAKQAQIKKQIQGQEQVVALLGAYQMAFAKDEAVRVLDNKMRQLSENVKKAKRNVGADNSIRELNPKLYNELVQSIEKDGERQYGELKKARDTLAGGDMSYGNGGLQANEANMPTKDDGQVSPPQIKEDAPKAEGQGEIPHASNNAPVVEENLLEDSIFSTPSVAEQKQENTQPVTPHNDAQTPDASTQPQPQQQEASQPTLPDTQIQAEHTESETLQSDEAKAQDQSKPNNAAPQEDKGGETDKDEPKLPF